MGAGSSPNPFRWPLLTMHFLHFPTFPLGLTRADIGTGQTSIQCTCWSTQISLVVFNAADERVEDSQWSISKYLARQQ
jgi:hypothetical protein